MKGLRPSWKARVILAVVVLAIWEIVSRQELVSPIIFGSPSLIFEAALKDGWTFLLAFRTTILEIVAAAVVACTLGISLGVISGSSPLLARLCPPVFSALMAIPLVILYPVLIAWLGLGPVSKIVFGALSGVFPIALNTVAGVRSIDPGYRMMAVAMGANRCQIMFNVLAPLALPAIVSGLRLGIALVVIGVVVSEMLGSADGIGFWISYHRSLFNTGQVYLGILLALMIAGVVNAGLSAVERFYSHHRADCATLTADR
jgi:NitT/TauT family transport system permease protein